MEFLFWTGLVFVVLGVGAWIDSLICRYGPTFSLWVFTSVRRFRLWRLDRRVSASIRRFGYQRAPSLGQLRFTQSRKESFNQDRG